MWVGDGRKARNKLVVVWAVEQTFSKQKHSTQNGKRKSNWRCYLWVRITDSLTTF